MSIETISSLKSFLSTSRNLKVCILDNNMIEVLTRVSSTITQESIFGQYDLILIPKWVYKKSKTVMLGSLISRNLMKNIY